jgi:hypothetical protein
MPVLKVSPGEHFSIHKAASGSRQDDGEEVFRVDGDTGGVRLGKSQALTAAGAIDLDASYVSLVGPASSTYAVTLAAPTAAQRGQVKTVQMLSTTSTNAVTLALTNVIGGTAASSASFDAANETLVLVAAAGKWLVVKQHGVTLS